MTQREQVILTDDLDGREAAETVSFALDGTSYEIDLSAKNATTLRTALQPFVDTARRGEAASRVTTSPRRGRAVQGGSPVSSQAVRAWARAHCIPVSPRGRIPADVVDSVSGSPTGVPVARSQARTVPSSPPVTATTRPSASTAVAAAPTRLVWPVTLWSATPR